MRFKLFTLSDAVSGVRTLTPKHKASFVKEFGHGCSEKRKDALKEYIDNLDNVNNWSVYTNVWFYSDGSCQGHSGQEYAIKWIGSGLKRQNHLKVDLSTT